MASDPCSCQKCRGTGQEQYYNACAPHNWYSRSCPDCHGSGIDSAKRAVVLETALRRLLVAHLRGVFMWNAETASEMRAATTAALEALEEGGTNE